MTQRYPILVVWGDDEPDIEHFEVEADGFEAACRRAYDEWSPTGWHHLTVYELAGGGFRSFDLSSPFEMGVDHGRGA